MSLDRDYVGKQTYRSPGERTISTLVPTGSYVGRAPTLDFRRAGNRKSARLLISDF